MPSLYEATVNTGEVSSSNFTTLYNASGLAVPNAGAGQITGNLNVGGNLTVQGNSLLVGDVTLQGNLCLPNYCFPYPDGNTDQVMVTDGNGNLTWVDVTAIPGADYNISATTATGGANLTLANTAGFTDSVKFASGTNMSIVRTDANTITISTVADNIPDGTVRGQVLFWDGSAWTANSTVSTATAGNRFVLQYENSAAGPNSALFLRKNYGAVNYSEANNDGVGINFSTASTAQGISSYASLNVEYSATDPQLVVNTSTDNFASDESILILQKSTASFYAPNITLNKDQSGAPTLNASITVERGSATNATITWDETDDRWELNNNLIATGLQGANVQIGLGANNEIYTGGQDLVLNTASGANNIQSNSPIQTTAQSMSINSDNTAADSQLNFKGTTQYLKWNNATTQFELSNATLVGGNLTVNGNYSQTGESMTINSDSTAADSFLYLKGTTEFLKWDNTNTRFEFSDQLYISQAEPPAIFERRTLSSDTSPYELKAGLKLINRVTDAANNDVVTTGPTIIFSRTSGASDPTERVFAGMGSAWDGATGTAQLQFTWTNDNFTEPTPGNFPGTYTLLALESNQSRFYNNSLYIDYSQAGAQKTATSITGGNTLVFASAHGFSIGQRIEYMSTTQNGLTQFAYYYVIAAGFTTTQCRLGLTSTGTAITLINGTGLTLNFAELVNQVGVNTNTPAYTLDVNGDAHVATDLTVDGDIYLSGVHVDLDVPVHQGQLLYVSDESPATITNSSTINFASATYRPNFQAKTGVYGRTQSGATISSNTGAVNYTTADGGSLLIGLQSDSQSLALIGSLSTAYNTSGDHQFRLTTSTNNFVSDQATSITGSNTLVFSTAHGFASGDKLLYSSSTQNGLIYDTTYYVIATGLTSTQCQVSLTLGGSAVALTNGTGLALWFFKDSQRLLAATSASVNILAPTLLFNATNTGIAGVSAGLEVERGTSGANSTFIWSETNDRWEASEDFFVQQATIGNIDIDRVNGQIDTNSGFNLTLDSDGGTVLINDNLNVDAGVLYVDSGSNEVGIGTLTPAYTLDVNGIINTNSSVQCNDVVIDSLVTYNTESTTVTAIGTPTNISSTGRTVQKVVIKAQDNVSGEIHCLEALAFEKGATAYLTTYAEMYTGLAALATFTADVSGGSIRILATLPVGANSTTFKVSRMALD